MQRAGARSRYVVFLVAVLCSICLFTSGALAARPTAEEMQNEIDQINRAIKQKGGKWKAGVTANTRMSPEERKMRFGVKLPPPADVAPEELNLPRSQSTLSTPVALDYRNSGSVTPVKDQEECLSCWAFATTAALESQIAMVTGAHLDLAEEVLVACGDHFSLYRQLLLPVGQFLLSVGRK